MKQIASLTILALISLLPVSAVAELTLASPFTDNAVLQRDARVPVWGKADPGATVNVQFDGQKKSSVADSRGSWTVELDPMPGTAVAKTLEVSDTETTVALSNVVVGEVWICSGQSNMQFGIGGVPEIKALADQAKNIRSFEVKRTVSFTEQDSCEGTWREQNPNSAVAFSFAHLLQQKTDVPVGIILTCWGSSSLEAWMPRDMTDSVPHFKTLMDEFDADEKTHGRITSILEGEKPWSRPDDIFLRRQSNILYNAMLHPLAPYGCRGLVWYQGERNTQSMFGMLKEPWFSRNSGMLKYGSTLKHWIERCRKEWGNESMHFMVVMLPGYHKPLATGPKNGPNHPAAHSWAWMRESQLQALDLPHTSVANTIDLGDVKNVHPRDKLPIGQRLAALAASDALGMEVPSRGPMFKSTEQKDGQVVVHFEHAEGLATTDGQSPMGFWLADDREEWVKADAALDGDTVVLSSPDLKKPLYVRYAFAGKPDVNLVNKAGWPAYPFRTDEFVPTEKVAAVADPVGANAE